MTSFEEVTILTVDCDELEEICERAEIRDFPTLSLFRGATDGKPIKSFTAQERG